MAMPIILTKNYREAAEAMQQSGLVKDATVSDAEVDGGNEMTVEGAFTVFDAHDMEMWGGHMRFVFRDTEAKTEESKEARGYFAMQAPRLAALFTSVATLMVYKRVPITQQIRTYVDGRYDGETSKESEEWRDVTEEFHQKVGSTFGFGTRGSNFR